MKVETIKVKSGDHPSGYIIVNKSDADKVAKPDPKPALKPKAK